MQCLYANAKAPNDLTGTSIWEPTGSSLTFQLTLYVCKWTFIFGFKAHSDSLQLWDSARTGCMYMCLGEAWRFHARGIHLLVRLGPATRRFHITQPNHKSYSSSIKAFNLLLKKSVRVKPIIAEPQTSLLRYCPVLISSYPLATWTQRWLWGVSIYWCHPRHRNRTTRPFPCAFMTRRSINAPVILPTTLPTATPMALWRVKGWW